MKKTISILLIVSLLAVLAGCGRQMVPALPENAAEFILGDYVNPMDTEDGYAAISYNGRIYAYYGTVSRSLRAADLGPCLGYTVQDGERQDDRICLLAADPQTNFLVELFPEAVMQQPVFYRALDSAGKPIEIPAYIESLDYSIWE